MTDVVVVGCGFAGFWAAVAARRVLGAGATIGLVAPSPQLVIRPRLYQADPATLAVDVGELFESIGVDFVAGTATGVDTDGRTVVADDDRRISYRRLIVASGSVIRRPPVPGAEHALAIDQLDDAISFDDRLRSVARTVSTPTVAVVGGGFTGIELALELRDRLARHGGIQRAEAARIVLVDRSDVVGAALGPGPRPVIEAAMADARIELALARTVTRFAPNQITFDDGTTLDADLVVLTTGMSAAPFASTVPGERDHLGRLVVDRHLRSTADRSIFVAGDAAHADTGDGRPTLQSCQHALQLGRVAGENAARSLLGRPLVPYVHARYVTCLDLGRSGAVFTEGWDRSITATGPEAKRTKNRINNEVIYPPPPGDPDALLAASQLPSGS